LEKLSAAGGDPKEPKITKEDPEYVPLLELIMTFSFHLATSIPLLKFKVLKWLT